MNRRLVLGLLIAGLALAAPALAQAAPFGLGTQPAPPPEGWLGWILSVQAAFYRDLSQALRAARTDPAAAFWLIGASLAYGVFHAAGPGHGKAVISAYLLANEASWRRGVVLAIASAALQALVAVILIAVVGSLVRMTAVLISDTVRLIEIAAYGGIVALGGWLMFVKGRAFAAAAGLSTAPAGDGCGPGCSHLPAPEAADLMQPGGLRRAALAVVSVGLRPCSGALVVLAFATANGVLGLGVAATFAMAAGTAATVAAIAALAVFAKQAAVRFAVASSGRTELLLRGLELLAALVVTAFGAALLAGYMAAERVLPF